MKKFFTILAAILFAGSMTAATSMTCAEAAEAALSVSGNNVEYNDGEEIVVEGYVTNIAFAWKEGSMSFWMADAADGGNVLEAYRCAIENEEDAPKVTDKVRVTGKLTKYNTTPEFATGCTCEILERGEGPGVVDIDVTDCASAAEAAMSVSGNNELYKDGEVFTVEGYVTTIQNPWSNGVITFWMADTPDGGKVLEAYKCAIENKDDAPVPGDKVAVTGNLTKYNTTPEFAEGCTCEILERGEAPKNLGEKTIAEFLEMKNMKDTCILKGTISGLPEDHSANAWKYGNFELTDETGTLYIYGLLTPDGQKQQFASMGLDNGSAITIKALYGEYNGSPQAANAILVEDVDELERITVAQACEEALKLGDNENSVAKYAVVGYVAKISEEYSEQYKNISFYMTDDATSTYGELQCRRAKVSEADKGLAAGDRVLIIVKLTNNFYNEKNTPQIYQGQASIEWKQAIENIVLTEKVNKVIVDGVLYIVRDGKLFNVQGAQVR